MVLVEWIEADVLLLPSGRTGSSAGG
eukprot:COSAG02_NODE_52655_length_306_cov_1.004831_1_plen_25_part_10